MLWPGGINAETHLHRIIITYTTDIKAARLRLALPT